MQNRVTIACVFLALLILFAGFVAGSPDYNGDCRDAQSPKQSAVVLTGQSRNSPSDRADCGSPKWYAALKRPEWLLVTVGIVTFIVIGWQSWETRKSADAATRGIKLQEANSRITAHKERPRITVKPGQCVFNPRETTKISYVIDCYCPSPAFIIDSSLEVFVVAPLMVEPLPLKIDIPRQIVKSEEVWKYAFVFAGAHPEIVNQYDVRAKKVTIHMRGFIKYTGIHLEKEDDPYATVFAYDWVPIEVLNSPDYGYWRDNGESKLT